MKLFSYHNIYHIAMELSVVLIEGFGDQNANNHFRQWINLDRLLDPKGGTLPVPWASWAISSCIYSGNNYDLFVMPS